MKKLLIICLFIAKVFTVDAQQLSGSLGPYSHDNVGNRYTNLNWEVSYTFEKRTDGIYLKYYNPKVTVAQNSLYSTAEKSYSKQDLGLAVWPQSYSPSSLNVSANITLPNGKTALSGCTFSTSHPYKTSEAWVYPTDLNGKEINLSAFKLSVTKVTYSPQPVQELDDRISAKNLQKTANTSNTIAQNSGSKSRLGTSQTSDKRTGSPIPSLESQYAKLGIPANTPTQTKQEVRDQVIGQVAGLAGELLNDWNANREQRIAAERASYERQRSIEAAEKVKKDREKFTAQYLPLMDKAKRGDENARMTLYFTSGALFSKDQVPQREQWLEEALNNNNTDALMATARIIAGKHGEPNYDFEKAIPYLERAVILGNVDAMVILATWYGGYTQAQNPKLALELFEKAAQKGSPNAMYYLGMIYQYGRLYDITKKFNKSLVQYDVAHDEKKALEWFMRSIQPDYLESLYSKSLLNNKDYFYGISSYFNPSSYREIANIYTKGKVVPKDKTRAKEFEGKYQQEFIYEKMNKQKFSR